MVIVFVDMRSWCCQYVFGGVWWCMLYVVVYMKLAVVHRRRCTKVVNMHGVRVVYMYEEGVFVSLPFRKTPLSGHDYDYNIMIIITSWNYNYKRIRYRPGRLDNEGVAVFKCLTVVDMLEAVAAATTAAAAAVYIAADLMMMLAN